MSPNGVDTAVSLFYGSQTGTAEEVAWELAREGRRRGWLLEPRALDETSIHELSKTKIGIFVVSTTGQGDPPLNMRRLWQEMLSASLPPSSLAKLSYTVFGLGDRRYREFNYAARKLHARLGNLGAKSFYRLGLGDDQHDFGRKPSALEQETDVEIRKLHWKLAVPKYVSIVLECVDIAQLCSLSAQDVDAGVGGGKGRRRGVLHFANQGLSDADIAQLDLCTEYDNDYEEVDFSDNSFSGRGLRCILDLCSRCRRLKVLKLFKNDLDDNGAELLARFLEHCPNLEELHLSHNRISSTGALSLISAGSSCRREGDTPLWLRLEHNCLESVEEAESWLYRQYSVCYKQNAECTARYCKYRCKIHAPYMAKQSPRGHSHQSPRPTSEPGRHRTWSHAYVQDRAAEEASYKRQRSWQRHDEGRGSGHEDRDRWDRGEHRTEELHLKKEGLAAQCADGSRLQHGPSLGGDSRRPEEAAAAQPCGSRARGEVKGEVKEESEDDVEIVEPGKGSDSASELQGSELQAWEAALRRWEARLDTREKKIRALQSSLPRAAREKLAQLVPPQVVLPRDRPYAFQRALAEAMSSADEPR
ncbi:ndor1 [Symbiodinium sp. CCMP2456]|nr:ndor1 [Symbiodinium sp. CCMP2456]